MANISSLLDIIKNSIYGRDMRSALHDSIEAVNEDVDKLFEDNTTVKKKLDELGEKTSDNNFTDAYKTELDNLPTELDKKVDKTDYAGQNKAGLVKIAMDLSRTAIEMDESNYITIIPANPGEIMTRFTNKPITPQNMNYAVKAALSDSQRISDMTVGEKANARDVISAVGFTDYATAESGGVVKVSEIYGTNIKDGKLSLIPATNADISQRLPKYHPIIPSNLDYAVRSVRPNVISSYNADISAVNTIYRLGSQQTLPLDLPGLAQYGDFIQVDFYSGKTPTNLTITCPGGSLSDIDLIPEANTMYSLYFDWGLVYCEFDESGNILAQVPGWRFSYAAYPHEEV